MGVYFSGAPPSMPELVRPGVHQQVAANYNYFTFGILLLNDKTGGRMSIIEDECRGKPERIVLRILQEWLEGKESPTAVTWELLIQTLRDTDLSVLAEQIETTKLSH